MLQDKKTSKFLQKHLHCTPKPPHISAIAPLDMDGTLLEEDAIPNLEQRILIHSNKLSFYSLNINFLFIKLSL
jgi:hypothetical protein